MRFCEVLVIDRHCLATGESWCDWALSQFVILKLWYDRVFEQRPAPSEMHHSRTYNQTKSTFIYSASAKPTFSCFLIHQSDSQILKLICIYHLCQSGKNAFTHFQEDLLCSVSGWNRIERLNAWRNVDANCPLAIGYWQCEPQIASDRISNLKFELSIYEQYNWIENVIKVSIKMISIWNWIIFCCC